MKACAVVVWYNPNLEMVKNIKTYLNYLEQVYIIDNSTKNNEELSTALENVKYISNNKNLGIAKALNVGCSLAIKDGYDIVLTMDQDSFFREEEFKLFLELGFKKMEKDSKLSIIAPSILGNEKKGYCDRVITSGNLLRMEAYKKLEGFRNDFFIDEVDHEFCYRLRLNGYKIFKEPSIYMEHQLGNIKKVKFLIFKFYVTNHSYIRRYYMTRNRLIVRKKFPKYTKGYIINCIKDTFKIILSEEDKKKKIVYTIKGIIDYKRDKLGEYKR